MTLDECLTLPNRTEVLLPEGRRGRLAVWHKATEAVQIAVVGENATVYARCDDLYWDDHRRVVWRPRELAPPRMPYSAKPPRTV